MSSNPTPAPRSLLVRFCDSFLQERNIKWMLAVGMLILLGSSVLLVSAHWETYTPVWKYLIFLGYTALIFAAGEWTRQRWVLPRTATVLQVLTVLLLPITFLVLHWVERKDAGLVENGFHVVFLLANLGFSVLAAGRIFHHFLREQQPTFLASFLILALAGAIVPGLPEAWAPLVALALWAVFAAGSVKVNRHVFWLTEEHRAPRILGFFPIMLLGAQFLTLFALHAPNKISLDWIGFGCVLTAIPVLLTADAVARVFQQRTGDLVRPLPWSIIGPLGLGLLLCAAGVCLAGVSIPTKPYALVLASAVAAVMMAVTARRTDKSAFVWAMLAGIVLAYNFSPAFFIDLVRDLLNQGARLVHEERLPYAFYGLTYLPLLLGLMLFGKRLANSGNDVFAKPLITFSIALGCLMLAVSFGHIKALFPVALCMTLMFSLQVILFRDGRLALLAIVSWIMTAAGFSAFAGTVLGWSLPAHAEMISLAIASALLLIVGRYYDGFISRLLPDAFGRDWGNLVQKGRQSLCQSCSLILALGLAGIWLGLHFAMPLDRSDWPISFLLIALVLSQFQRRRAHVRLPLLVLVNWQIIFLVVLMTVPTMQLLQDLNPNSFLPICLPVACVAAVGLFFWQFFARELESPLCDLVLVHLWALRVLAFLAVCRSLDMPSLTLFDILLAGLAFSLAVAAELTSACRQEHEERVWIGLALALAAIGYFTYFQVLTIGKGTTMFAILGAGFLLWLVGEWARGRGRLNILTGPLQQIALVLPLATVAIGVYRHLAHQPIWLGANSLALLLAAGFYFWRGLERSLKSFVVLSGVILNIALVLLWRELAWDDPQFFMIPVGISILALVQLLKQEIPERFHDPLRYLGALVILVSPTFHIVDGSWLHLFSLMVASVGVVLVAIGLRVRALMYTGTAFLVADLVAMVVRGTIDDPNVLWISGLALGAAVIALGAWCERNRENLVERMRFLAEALKQWE